MLRVLDRLEEILIAFLIAFATVIIFAAVVQRYSLSTVTWAMLQARGFDLPWAVSALREIFDTLRSVNMTWAQELCIYAFVWMAKFGAAYGVRTGIHVGVDVVLVSLPDGPRKRLVLFGLMAGALFTGIVGTLGATFVWEIAHTEQTSADLEMPMWIVYLAVPLGSYLMCFRFLQVAWSFARHGELPRHDHAHVDGIDDADAETHPAGQGGTR